MDKLQQLYHQAVERTKAKIKEDIERYMEGCEEKPSIKDYLEERSQFLNYIWQNIWLNKVQSAYSVKERKKYLIDQGVAFDSQSKK